MGPTKRRAWSRGGGGAARKGRSPRVDEKVKKMNIRDVVEKGKVQEVKKQMGYKENKQ